MPRSAARRRTSTVLAVALAAASVALGAGPAAAASAGGISVRPGHADPNDTATRAYFKPTVAPGGTFVDFVAVTNTSDAPLDLLVSGVDGLTGATSGAVYANRQDPARKAGAWIRPAVARFTIAAHSERDVGFTVRVPAGTPPGDHLAGIAFENAHPQASSGNFAVTEVIRAVIGVQVRVPGPARFRVHVDGVQIHAAPGLGTASVVVTLGNDGGLLGKPSLSVTVNGLHGYHRAVVHQLDTVLPGDTIPFPLPWPDTLGTGDYSVIASVEGLGQSASTTAAIHLGTAVPGATGGGQPASAPIPARRSHQPTWPLALLVVPVAILAGVIIGRRSRRPPAPPAASDSSHHLDDIDRDELMPAGRARGEI